MAIKNRAIQVRESKGVLEFGEIADRHPALYIGGKLAVDLTFDCPSCTLVFERAGDTELDPSPTEVSAMLEQGITSIEAPECDAISQFLPVGDYRVAISEVTPTLVRPGDTEDFFTNDFVATSGRAHNPAAAYYLAESGRRFRSVLGERTGFSQLVVPLYDPNHCDMNRVAEWQERLLTNRASTALAMSWVTWVERNQSPCEESAQPPPESLFVLTHFLLDGHHRMLAAARAGVSLSLLMFLRLRQQPWYKHGWESEVFDFLDQPD
jgi:hypothetical protein